MSVSKSACKVTPLTLKQSVSGEPPIVVTTTVRNYDLLETSKAIRGLATGIAMTGFMHL